MIGLQPVPVTCSVQVHGVGKLTSEQLELHFEDIDGVDNAKVELRAEDGCAVVHLDDTTGKKFLWITINNNIIIILCYPVA